MTRRRHSARTLAARLLDFGGKCAGCGCRVGGGAGLDWDHVIPLELGGPDEPENLQPLCKMCHKSKTHKDIKSIRKAERQRQRTAGIKRTVRNPINGSKASGWKHTFNHGWERR